MRHCALKPCERSERAHATIGRVHERERVNGTLDGDGHGQVGVNVPERVVTADCCQGQYQRTYYYLQKSDLLEFQSAITVRMYNASRGVGIEEKKEEEVHHVLERALGNDWQLFDL